MTRTDATPEPPKIRLIGDNVLRSRAVPVTLIDASIAGLIEQMSTAMYAAPGAGITAPQVGAGVRVVLHDIGTTGAPQVLINPEIIETSGRCRYNEGCLSIPGVTMSISRPEKIHVRATDPFGSDLDFDADGFLARLIQHEIDHLNGVLMIDRLSGAQLKRARREVRQLNLH
mgnify:CR=1 FL=1